jgi:hypothetical protein
MTAGTAARLAWPVWGLSTALLAFALLSPRTEENSLAILLPLATGALAWSTVGALVVSRRPENPIGWIVWAMGLLSGVALSTAQYATYALLGGQERALPGTELLGLISSWIWVPIIGLLIFLLLLFPNGRLPSRRWRPVAWLGGLVIAVGATTEALVPGPIDGLEPLRNPFGIESAKGTLALLTALSQAAAGVLLLVAVASLFARLLRAGGAERQQVKWLAYAGTVLAVNFFLGSVSGAMSASWVGFVLGMVGFVGIPAAVGIAVLRYRLYDIDVIINRTLVYGSLTAALVAVYVGSVVLLQSVFRALTGQESQLAIVASTLVIAALFQPLRRRVQGFIDRRFYRRRYDAARTLQAFGTRLRDEVDLGTLTDDLVGVVRETVQPTHASLWLRDSAPDRKLRAGG